MDQLADSCPLHLARAGRLPWGRHSSAFYTDCTELGRPLSAWEAPNEECGKVRKDFEHRKMSEMIPDHLKRCKDPIYIHSPGRWEECCYLRPKSHASAGMRYLWKMPELPEEMHCRTLAQQDREVTWDGDVGSPSGTCGTGSAGDEVVDCSGPGRTCLTPRRVAAETNFTREVLAKKTRHMCLAVGGRDEGGEMISPAWVQQGKKKPVAAKVYYMASPWSALALPSPTSARPPTVGRGRPLRGRSPGRRLRREARARFL